MDLFAFQVNTPETFSINDIVVKSTTISNLSKEISCLISSKEQKSKQIITLNTDFLRISYLDKDFKDICTNNCIVVPDGIGVILLLFLRYHKKIDKITGCDLFDICLTFANTNKLKIALVGSTVKTHSILSDKIKKEFPSIVLKTISPVFEFETIPKLNNEVINELKIFCPDILFVALGCPRQEKWIHTYKDLIGAKINIGVGAVFDFYAGTKKRAPKFVRTIWLEWFWRLLHEPRRLFKRYIILGLPFFIKTSLQQIFSAGKNGQHKIASINKNV